MSAANRSHLADERCPECGLPSNASVADLYGAQLAWLIEWPAEELVPVRWFKPGRAYTLDANQALRFSRRQDAEAFIRAEKMSAKAVQHSWVEMPQVSA